MRRLVAGMLLFEVLVLAGCDAGSSRKRVLPAIDYDSFQKRLVSALRSAWQEVRAQRPGEKFYMYGVETDSEAVVLTPFCNTEEQFAAEHGTPQHPVEKWMVDQDSKLYGAGSQHTAQLQNEVNQYYFEDEPDAAYEERIKRLMQVFEKALAELDAEGFFGSGDERRKIVLRVDIVDAGDGEWKSMVEIMKRINPPESLATLLPLLEALQAESQ